MLLSPLLAAFALITFLDNGGLNFDLVNPESARKLPIGRMRAVSTAFGLRGLSESTSTIISGVFDSDLARFVSFHDESGVTDAEPSTLGDSASLIGLTVHMSL